MEVAIMSKLKDAASQSFEKAAPVVLLDWYNLHSEPTIVTERPVPSTDMLACIGSKGSFQLCSHLPRQLAFWWPLPMKSLHKCTKMPFSIWIWHMDLVCLVNPDATTNLSISAFVVQIKISQGHSPERWQSLSAIARTFSVCAQIVRFFNCKWWTCTDGHALLVKFEYGGLNASFWMRAKCPLCS